jgi:hypothetical protein
MVNKDRLARNRHPMLKNGLCKLWSTRKETLVLAYSFSLYLIALIIHFTSPNSMEHEHSSLSPPVNTF